MKKTERKYNSLFRKKIANKIENLKDKDKLILIYNICKNDINDNFSSNRNGIFINLNLLNDNTIVELIKLLEL